MNPFKIMVMGTSGAGKTMFLASLYQKLHIQQPEIGFYLTANGQHGELLKAYSVVRDSARSWPDGTRLAQTKEFTFDCRVSGAHGDFTVMKLQYLDYAGGVLSGDVEQPEVMQRLNESDAFLVIIDGQKALQSLSRKGPDIDDFDTSLEQTFGYLQSHVRKPLHLVVTKWDIVNPAHSLRDVIDLLNMNSSVRGIISQRRRVRYATRIIPVSAVGRGFADYVPPNDMRKRPGARANPENVQLPISCLLPDLIAAAALRIEEDRAKAGKLRRALMRTLTSTSLLATISKELVDKIPTGAFTSIALKAALTKLLSSIIQGLEKPQAAISKTWGAAVADPKTVEEAFTALMRANEREIHLLNRDYPESLLSEGAG